jgi:hypothetical protein
MEKSMKHKSSGFRVQLMKWRLLWSYFIFLFITAGSNAWAQNEHSLRLAEYKLNVVKKIAELIENKYVDANKAPLYAHTFLDHYNGGSYQSIVDRAEFVQQVNNDLIKITKDMHFSLRQIETTSGKKDRNSLRHPIRYHYLGLKENMGFSKFEWMDESIAYFKIDRFYNYADIKAMINAMMKLMKNAQAIIIDIRENAGGSGDYLSSYFLPHPIQLNGWYSREENYLTEYWTISYIGMKPMVDVPLFILTSDKTFSAAESFAYDMKIRQRAIIIGDSTKGGAHSVDLYQINDEFEIYIPTVRAVNPLTGTNWEGSGVVPDILVSASMALDTAYVLAKKAATEFSKSREKKLNVAIENMKVYMKNAEKYFRQKAIKPANAALDSVFYIAKRGELLNEFFIDVLAYNYFSPKDEDLLYAILERKIKFFPDSPNAYESLAFAYFRNNKFDLAINMYNEVLKRDPDNRNASKIIVKIQGN